MLVRPSVRRRALQASALLNHANRGKQSRAPAPLLATARGAAFRAFDNVIAHTHCVTALAAWCAILGAQSASANPVVNVGNYVAAPNATVSIPINVFDPAANPVAFDIEGMNLVLQLGDGVGTSPSFNSVDALTGTIWPAGSTQDLASSSGPQFQNYGILTPSFGVAVNDNGRLATVSISAGAVEGTYAFNMVGTAYPGNDSVFLDGNGNTVPGTFTNGTFTVTSHTWTGASGATWDTGGSWSAGSWSAGSRPGTGQNAYFPAAIPSSGAKITLGSLETPGSISFGGSYTLNGGSLALSGSNIAVYPNMTVTINSPITTPASGLTLFGGGTLTIGAASTFVGPVAVNQGTLTLGVSQRIPSVSVGVDPVGASILLAKTATPGGNVLTTNSLTLAGSTGAWLGTVDIGNGGMIVNYTASGTSPIATLADQITSGYANGAWTGNGITSSSAAAASVSRPGHAAIGYGEASTILGITGTQTGTFLGQTVNADSVLARYTTYGDANLDGKVTFTDFVTLSNHFGQTVGPNGWAEGDFNYDGKVTFADFVLLSNNFGTLTPVQTMQVHAWESTVQADVPEPASVAVLGIAAIGLLGRRRRV